MVRAFGGSYFPLAALKLLNDGLLLLMPLLLKLLVEHIDAPPTPDGGDGADAAAAAGALAARCGLGGLLAAHCGSHNNPAGAHSGSSVPLAEATSAGVFGAAPGTGLATDGLLGRCLGAGQLPVGAVGAAVGAAAWELLSGPYGAYVCAGLLGLAAAVKALLGAHYEYRMNVVSNR